MASKRRLRRKACEGKVRYKSSKSAHNEAMRRSRMTGHRLNSYRCEFCGGHHIGHMPYKIKQRIAASRRK